MIKRGAVLAVFMVGILVFCSSPVEAGNGGGGPRSNLIQDINGDKYIEAERFDNFVVTFDSYQDAEGRAYRIPVVDGQYIAIQKGAQGKFFIKLLREGETVNEKQPGQGNSKISVAVLEYVDEYSNRLFQFPLSQQEGDEMSPPHNHWDRTELCLLWPLQPYDEEHHTYLTPVMDTMEGGLVIPLIQVTTFPNGKEKVKDPWGITYEVAIPIDYTVV